MLFPSSTLRMYPVTVRSEVDGAVHCTSIEVSSDWTRVGAAGTFGTSPKAMYPSTEYSESPIMFYDLVINLYILPTINPVT